MKTIISIMIVATILIQESAAQFVFVGPMWHWTIGSGNQRQFGFGIEASFWENESPIGYDIGIEFAKDKLRLYSELESGIVIFGLAGGIVCELSKEKIFKLGLQGSAWGACFIGGDIRFRYMGDELNKEIGIFAKVPVKFKPKLNFFKGNMNFDLHMM